MDLSRCSAVWLFDTDMKPWCYDTHASGDMDRDIVTKCWHLAWNLICMGL